MLVPPSKFLRIHLQAILSVLNTFHKVCASARFNPEIVLPHDTVRRPIPIQALAIFLNLCGQQFFFWQRNLLADGIVQTYSHFMLPQKNWAGDNLHGVFYAKKQRRQVVRFMRIFGETGRPLPPVPGGVPGTPVPCFLPE